MRKGELLTLLGLLKRKKINHLDEKQGKKPPTGTLGHRAAKGRRPENKYQKTSRGGEVEGE